MPEAPGSLLKEQPKDSVWLPLLMSISKLGLLLVSPVSALSSLGSISGSTSVSTVWFMLKDIVILKRDGRTVKYEIPEAGDGHYLLLGAGKFGEGDLGPVERHLKVLDLRGNSFELLRLLLGDDLLGEELDELLLCCEGT
jgi:hypothetical protein